MGFHANLFAIKGQEIPERTPKSFSTDQLLLDINRRTGLEDALASTVTSELLDAKVETVRAQNDARFAEVIAKLDVLSGKIDAVQRDAISWKSVWGAAAATTAAIAGVSLGVLAIGGDRFDGGMAASGVVSGVLQQQATKFEAQFEAQDARIEQVIQQLELIATQSSGPPTLRPPQNRPFNAIQQPDDPADGSDFFQRN